MVKHNMIWKINHLKILRAMNNGAKTQYEIMKQTGIYQGTIGRHQKEIVECPYCHHYIDKTVFCFFCGFRLVQSYG